MIHESAAWSNVHQKWFFLPRRCSKEPYNELLDEHRGCSVLISTNADISDIKVVKVSFPFSLTIFLKSTSKYHSFTITVSLLIIDAHQNW